MREILFRGKTACGAWVQGDLIHRKIWSSKFEVIRVDDSGFDNYTEYEIATDTIGQFTGLTDKNGNKIFEGDIVKVDGKLYEVKYMLGQFYIGINMPISYKRFDCEVVGNIFDNAELIK